MGKQKNLFNGEKTTTTTKDQWRSTNENKNTNFQNL